MKFTAAPPFVVCYKIPNRLDEGYETKLVEAPALPPLRYIIEFDKLLYEVASVECHVVGRRAVYFVLLQPSSDESFVDESMLLQVAEHLLILPAVPE